MIGSRWILGIALVLCGTGSFAAFASAQTTPPSTEPAPSVKPKLNIAKELGLFGPSGVGGQEKQVTLAGSFTIERGSHRGVLSLSATMAPGWHVYSVTQKKGATQPSKITPAESESYKVLGQFRADRDPVEKTYPFYSVPVEEHPGKVVWSAPIELAEDVKPEGLIVPLEYNGQVCSDKVCIPLTERVEAAFAGFTALPETLGEYHPAANQAELVLKGHVEPAAIAPGGKARLVLTAIPNPGWHVYAYAPKDPDVVGSNKPTLIYVKTPAGWTRSPTNASAEPKTKAAALPRLPKERYHDEPVTWTVELTAPANAATGETLLTGYVGLQTCKEGCLPPHGVEFRAGLPVKAATEDGKIPLQFISLQPTGDGAPASEPAVAGYKDIAKLAAATESGRANYSLPVILVFSLLGGFILNLMPCVLPVIGLKVLSFVQQGGESRARIFALNVWFSLGLLLVFLLLATAATFANLSWGEHFGILGFQVAMVVLVFAFALSFLGVWEIPIPGFAQSSTSNKLQQQEGPAGAFSKGIFTTVLATPCSGPFLGTVFGYTLTQPPLVTYLIFTFIGLGMASPYLVIGAFPTLVRWLPKPGAWMDVVKQLMGFVLLGTVVYLFTLVNEEYRIATLALVMGVWFACWLIGQVPAYLSVGKQLAVWVGGCAAATAIGVFAFAYLGPAKEVLPWQPYSPESLAKLQREGKTVMVDFTADWCPTCKVNLALAINTPRVKEVVERNGIVPLLADWSDRGPVIKAKLNELNSDSIPLMAIYPGDKAGEVIVLRDLLLESQVVNALESAGPSKPATADATAMANPRG